MLRLEGFMEIQKLHHNGLSVSAIDRQLNMDRKTVRKYLGQTPRAYEGKPKGWKSDPFRVYLRERWELGVQNAARLFTEIRKRGYVSHRLVAKDCLVSYRDNRYSVPHAHAGRSVTVREPLNRSMRARSGSSIRST